MGSSGRDSGDLLSAPMMGCGKSARGREGEHHAREQEGSIPTSDATNKVAFPLTWGVLTHKTVISYK